MKKDFQVIERPVSEASYVDRAREEYLARRRNHWGKIATARQDTGRGLGSFYQKHLMEVYRFLVPRGMKVLEVGCSEGDLLAALEPRLGVGIDFSGEMVTAAKQRYPHLTFLEMEAHSLDELALGDDKANQSDGHFDFVILSDLVNDLWDVQEVLVKVRKFCAPHTRLIINFHSYLWEHPLRLMQRLGKITPRLEQNWFTPDDMATLLDHAGFEVIRSFDDFLWPFETPVLAPLCNRYLAKLWPFRLANLAHFQICRPRPAASDPLSVTVVVPARNEAGNIEAAITRTPEMGAGTEIIFVEGHSSDNTWDAIQEAIARHPERHCKAFRQTGKGKGDAVRLGFSEASGDILMILDADLTVPPEMLPQFYEAIQSGRAEFVNGVRLIYPQEKQAMRFFNLLGNKFFSLAFSWLLGRNIKDTLCGTKVLRRDQYLSIVANRSYFGDFDPFGDFDLIFGAAKLNLKIMDMPVRYRERTYGDTNISRWRDGWLLLRMVAFAARRIKFVA